MSKLLWDEFFWLWSRSDTDLSDEQCCRQHDIKGALRAADLDKYERVRHLANKIRGW